MKYVIFTNNDSTSYLPIDEFYSYIDKDIISEYMADNGINDTMECATRFKADIQSNFNGYSQTGLKIDSVANSFIELSDKINVKCIDECRLEFAEYALNNYREPTSTLNKITANLSKHNKLPIKRISCQNDIDSVKSSLNLIDDSDFLSELASNNDYEWDSFERMAR